MAHPAETAVIESHTEATATSDCPDEVWDQKWGIWESVKGGLHESNLCNAASNDRYRVRLHIAGHEVRGSFPTREAALAFQTEQLREHCCWPQKQATRAPERSPTWDHPEELEPLKEYSFLEPVHKCSALSETQIKDFCNQGYLMGLPILGPAELCDVLIEFETLLSARCDRAPSDEARFRAAHTISRPLHQELVARLAKHERVNAIVGDILGPCYVVWSAHLFCKLPGDPTAQPWHQDAGFWPLSQSRALTLWIAFDDVDVTNSGVTFIEGSHRLGRLPWQQTESTAVLLTQEIPNPEMLGRMVHTELRAGQATVHSDLTVHGSLGNASTRRRAGLALRFVRSDADCLGPMINGYRMNAGCILPKGPKSDPRGHWKALRRRPGGRRATARFKDTECSTAATDEGDAVHLKEDVVF